jgi:hypothetical protein
MCLCASETRGDGDGDRNEADGQQRNCENVTLL